MNETLEQITARATAEAIKLYPLGVDDTINKISTRFLRREAYIKGVVAEATRDKWIRVEDGFPELKKVSGGATYLCSDNVLVITENGICEAYYTVDGPPPHNYERAYWASDHNIVTITHWQPLPTPPSK